MLHIRISDPMMHPTAYSPHLVYEQHGATAPADVKNTPCATAATVNSSAPSFSFEFPANQFIPSPHFAPSRLWYNNNPGIQASDALVTVNTFLATDFCGIIRSSSRHDRTSVN